MSKVTSRHRWTIASVQAAWVFVSALASAQPAGNPGGGGAAPAGGAGGQAAPAGGTTTTTTQVVPVYPGVVAPTPPGKPLGGGNVTSSSSMPKSGNESDTFDLLPNSGGSGTAFGSPTGPVFLEGRSTRIGAGTVPGAHVVRRGDTLWDICDHYFENPYLWPRVWSMNPQLQNPHWIFPGDVIRLRLGGGGPGDAAGAQGSLIDKRRQVRNGTVFLRDEGFVDDTADENWGELNGAPVDKMFLSDFDEVYLKIGGDRSVKLGQELTVYRPVRKVQGGTVVQLQGTVRVDQWNAKERVARAQITETLEVIERGARVGPIQRKFEIVPPVRNEKDIEASVLSSIYPHAFFGQNQVVFINKGEKEGVVVGNRFFIIRKGDAWRKSLASDAAAKRIALESDSPAQIESVPTPRRDSALPEEVVGELRIVALRPHTAAALVSQARGEIELGDVALARKGY